MKTLIYTVGLDDTYAQLANMLAHTARMFRYQGDIKIFTDKPRTSNWAEFIDISTHPDAPLVKAGAGFRKFHKDIPVALNGVSYQLEWDYFKLKYLPGTIGDRYNYDKILYLDADILIKEPLEEVFKPSTITSGYCGLTILNNLGRLTPLLNSEELDRAARMKSFSGGAFMVPSAHYEFLDHAYREYTFYSEKIRVRHDQHVLALMALRYAHIYELQAQYPKDRYWKHYWGGAQSKLRMIQKYQTLKGEKTNDNNTRSINK